MTLIGLCGPSGSGKTLVGSLFAMEGFAHIDCDKLVHNVVYKRADVRAAVAQHFGKDMLTDEGIDRNRMRQIVFNDAQKLRLLNDILKDAIIQEIHKAIAQSDSEYALLDAPTLFEAGLDKECKAVIAMIAPRNTCIERIMNRDGITREQAEQRLSRQKSEEFFRKHCRYLLENDGNIVGLTKKALALAEQIKKEK